MRTTKPTCFVCGHQFSQVGAARAAVCAAVKLKCSALPRLPQEVYEDAIALHVNRCLKKHGIMEDEPKKKKHRKTDGLGGSKGPDSSDVLPSSSGVAAPSSSGADEVYAPVDVAKKKKAVKNAPARRSKAQGINFPGIRNHGGDDMDGIEFGPGEDRAGGDAKRKKSDGAGAGKPKRPAQGPGKGRRLGGGGGDRVDDLLSVTGLDAAAGFPKKLAPGADPFSAINPKDVSEPVSVPSDTPARIAWWHSQDRARRVWAAMPPEELDFVTSEALKLLKRDGAISLRCSADGAFVQGHPPEWFEAAAVAAGASAGSTPIAPVTAAQLSCGPVTSLHFSLDTAIGSRSDAVPLSHILLTQVRCGACSTPRLLLLTCSL